MADIAVFSCSYNPKSCHVRAVPGEAMSTLLCFRESASLRLCTQVAHHLPGWPPELHAAPQVPEVFPLILRAVHMHAPPNLST
jgi:hypothetical protein